MSFLYFYYVMLFTYIMAYRAISWYLLVRWLCYPEQIDSTVYSHGDSYGYISTRVGTSLYDGCSSNRDLGFFRPLWGVITGVKWEIAHSTQGHFLCAISQALGAYAFGRGGSSPLIRTKAIFQKIIALMSDFFFGHTQRTSLF